MDSEDEPPEVQITASSPVYTQRTVHFSQPLADYVQDLDELIDFSSSDLDSDSDSFAAGSKGGRRGPGNHSASMPDQSTISDSVRGKIKSSYLERNDYRALLDSLKHQNQHDTAKHLMTFSLVKQLSPSESRTVAPKGYRSSWTRWPMPSYTLPLAPVSDIELEAELAALIHATAYRKLRAAGREISDDEIQESIMAPMVGKLMDDVRSVLTGMSRIKYARPATLRKLPPESFECVLGAVRRAGVLRPHAMLNMTSKCTRLFGGIGGSDIGDYKMATGQRGRGKRKRKVEDIDGDGSGYNNGDSDIERGEEVHAEDGSKGKLKARLAEAVEGSASSLDFDPLDDSTMDSTDDES